MKYENSHLSDQQMLMDVDGELSPKEEAAIRAHLDACWRCRVRRGEIEHAITDFVRFYQKESDGKVPPVEGPRALLRARIAQLSAMEPARPSIWFQQ
jgi:anti-sigma factor RsiW